MNMTIPIKIFLILCITPLTCQAQGSFQNLNFEQAHPGSTSPAFNVPVSEALPFWSVFYGNVQQTEIDYNVISTGATSVALIGGSGAIDGNYSVLLTGGATASAASISQTAIIPSGTQSLSFEAQPWPFGGLQVSIGNQNIPFVAIGTGPSYTLYGANISAWAGDDEQLTFSALEGFGLNEWEIDDISFSQTAVAPEPNAVILTGVGGLILAARRKFCRR